MKPGRNVVHSIIHPMNLPEKIQSKAQGLKNLMDDLQVIGSSEEGDTPKKTDKHHDAKEEQ